MRPLFFLALLAGCGASSEIATTPETIEPAPAIEDAPVNDAVGAAPASLQRYASAVCRLYTEAECVSAQRESCAQPMAFASMSECSDLIVRTADGCKRPVDQILADHATAVAECEALLGGHSCGSEPFCTDAGKIDEQGPCAEVSKAIAAECPMLEDDA